MSFNKYANVYRQYFTTNASVEMSFRFSFFLVFLVEVSWLFILLFHNKLIFANINGNFNDWNYYQFGFFSVMVALYDQLFLGFFAKNFWMFSETLRTGTMDFILTKPVSSLFSVFTRYQRISALFAALISIVPLVYFAQKLEIEITLAKCLGVLTLFALGMLLRVGIEIIIGTFMFITVEGEAVNIIRLNIQQFAKHPDFIYSGAAKIILTYLVPLCLVTSLPPTWFYGQHAEGFVMALLLLSVLNLVVWSIVGCVWKWGINHYESASS